MVEDPVAIAPDLGEGGEEDLGEDEHTLLGTAVHGRDAGQAMREIGLDTLAVFRDHVPEARRRPALEERRGRHAMACQGVLRDTDPAARSFGPQILNPRRQLDGGTEVRDRLRRRLIAVAVDAGTPAPVGPHIAWKWRTSASWQV